MVTIKTKSVENVKDVFNYGAIKNTKDIKKKFSYKKTLEDANEDYIKRELMLRNI